MSGLAQNPYGGDRQLIVGQATPAVAAAPSSTLGGLRLPSHEQVTYTRDLLVLVLFVIAFPWVLHKLVTNPSKLLAGSGVKAGL